MPDHQTIATQQLNAFTDHIRELVATADFQEQLAQPLWTAMKPHADRHLRRLERAVSVLHIEDQTGYDRFAHILGFSEKTLRWAQADELALIEALSETAELLLKRLNAANMIKMDHLDAVARLLATYSHQMPTERRGGSWAYLERPVRPAMAPARDHVPPDWSPIPSPDTTPATAGVYS